MLYKIAFLLFLTSFLSPLYGTMEAAHSNTDTTPNDSAPLDLLPPLVEKDANADQGEKQLDLRTQLQDLEARIKHLEILLAESLPSLSLDSSTLAMDSPTEGLDLTLEPVKQFEHIKQLAVARDPSIESAVLSFKAKYSDHTLVSKVHFFLADYYYSQKDYEKAIDLIKEGLVAYKDSAEVPRAIWILSLILIDTGKGNEACTTLKKLLSLPQKVVSIDLRENATKQYQRLHCQ